MKTGYFILTALLILLNLTVCGSKNKSVNPDSEENFSGVYCLNIQNLEMTIHQETGDSVTFMLQTGMLMNGTGSIRGDSLFLAALTEDSAAFSSEVRFSENRRQFSGPFRITGPDGEINIQGDLVGLKGACAKFDIETSGIPRFITHDFTELSKIKMISRFRSGFGHSYTDGTEYCRSMKHYYTPYESYRKNNTVKIFSPVKGTIVTCLKDYEAGGSALQNIEVHIRPDTQPAFDLTLFHCDLVSDAVKPGKQVQSGELIGTATMYYEAWQETVTSFDIAVWVSTPSGSRLVSYFEVLSDSVFDAYQARGVESRENFIITEAERDADFLTCDGEAFENEGQLDNWVILK